MNSNLTENDEASVLDTSPEMMVPEPSFGELLKAHLGAMRPKQWTKNLIVLAVPLFAFQFGALPDAVLALLLFCCVSGGFYIINDLKDIESDRRHPVKRNRPIAAGLVKRPTAITMATVLLLGSLLFSSLWRPSLALTLLAYVVVQSAYNIKLKHKPIADIGAISLGFFLRAYAGSASTGIEASPWFLLCTSMLALFLAIEKRKAELKMMERYGGHTRHVLRRYSLAFLSKMESTVTTCTIICYALWSSGPQLNGASTPWMLATLPFVMYGVFRYQFLVDTIDRQYIDGKTSSKSAERPEEILLRDRPILATVLTWIVATVIINLFQKTSLLT